MGSKNPDPPQTTPQAPPQTDYSGIVEKMMMWSMEQQMQQQQYSQMQQQQISMMPEPTEPQETLWDKRREELNASIAEDSSRQADARRGRASTIRTSILEEDAPSTVSSALTGV
jgi:hypothetical protein